MVFAGQPRRVWQNAAIWGFIVAILIISACGVLLGRFFDEVQNQRQLVDHSYDVRRQISVVLAGMTDAETGQRGFLLNGHPDELGSYRAELDRLPGEVALLAEKVRDNAAQSALASRLVEQVAKKLGDLGRGVDQAQRGRTSTASAEPQGSTTMSEIRTLIQAMRAIESDLLQERRRAADGEVRRLQLWGMSLLFATTVALTAAAFLMNREARLRSAADRTLRESEARYRVLAETTGDVITRLDLQFGTHYVSPASRQVLGYEPEELVAEEPFAGVHPEDVAELRRLTQELAAGALEGDRAMTTYRLQHKGGHWVWIEAGVNLVRDPDNGEPESLIYSLRDVTERQRIARQLKDAKAAAEDAANLKSEFIANMSHELRTPLTGMLGVHDLLRCDPSLTASQRRLIGIASDSGRCLLAIVNDVLDFSKIEAGQLTMESVPFEVSSMIEACRDLVAEEATIKSLNLIASCGAAEVTLVGDPGRLRQIILNLLTNAIKFTERGTIVIRADYEKRTGRLRIEVSDTGTGIAHDKKHLLFERFSQGDASTTRRYGGTGLGLAICKRLVELMDGTIGVVSEAGLGSSFWFELSLPEAQLEAVHSPLDGQPIARQTGRVLLVEDNSVNQDIIATMMEQRGHRVTSVGDGAASVAAVFAGPKFDLILMDLQMPVMDGLTATRAIRAAEAAGLHPRTPIIGLTANAMVDDVTQCLEAGMDAHVAKPFDWTDLFNVMDRALSASQVAPQTVRPGNGNGSGSSILEATTLAALSAIVGPAKVIVIVTRFISEIEQRLSGAEAAGAADIAAQAHSLFSLAGQLGFSELSALCAEIEAEEGRGGSRRVEELHAVGSRAVAAAKHYLERAA